MYYCPISTILKAMALEQDTSSRSEKFVLVVGKEASTLSKLHGIANCVKNGTGKIVSSNRYQCLARCSVTHNYFWSSLRILFTVFLEMKTNSGNYCEPFRGAALAAVATPCICPCTPNQHL